MEATEKRVYPPSPRFIGLIELAGNSQKIYGAQSLTGKILMSKNLLAEVVKTASQNGPMCIVETARASSIIVD